MLKTEMQIERDFYAFIKASRLAAEIGGEVYYDEMRPRDAKTEDVVLRFLTGLDTQVQTGIVVVNIYVPDIPFGKDGRMVWNKTRICDLEELILAFVSEGGGTEYELSTDSTPSTYANEDIGQHIVAAKIKFKRLS